MGNMLRLSSPSQEHHDYFWESSPNLVGWSPYAPAPTFEGDGTEQTPDLDHGPLLSTHSALYFRLSMGR